MRTAMEAAVAAFVGAVVTYLGIRLGQAWAARRERHRVLEALEETQRRVDQAEDAAVALRLKKAAGLTVPGPVDPPRVTWPKGYA